VTSAKASGGNSYSLRWEGLVTTGWVESARDPRRLRRRHRRRASSTPEARRL